VAQFRNDWTLLGELVMELTQGNSTPGCFRSEKGTSRNHRKTSTRASLQICHNDARVPKDIVGKLWLDTYLNGFWKEPRQSVILIVEVQDQWKGPFLLK